MMQLLSRIKDEIEQSLDEAITYERFMSLALYDKDYGYYNVEKQKTGREGDFYTSSSVHGVFARVIAGALIEAIQENQIMPVIVDVGSGDGRFIQSFLDEVKEINHSLYKKIQYYVVESSPFHQKLIKKLTVSHPVTLYGNIRDLKERLPRLNGILISNELLDAFPVRVVEKYDGELLEVCVGLDNQGTLIDMYKPCTSKRIVSWIEDYGSSIEEGQRMEIPLMMTEWLKDVGTWISNGRVYTIDYGYTNEEWKHPARRNGSLRGYSNHQIIGDPLLTPGKIDLTTHIHIDAVKKIGEQRGLTWLSCEYQGAFLLKHGLLNFIQETSPEDPFSPTQRQNRAIRWLSQSNQFRVIVQEKREN
ncbi:SAM-dependent methyltransferase [Pseudalkalibacillus hwajinpoensis]|uniref:SAM-dependent methyltransferase n=1 Tax=Guptibacillus hwajinpoensis TaxID=208199 RepID=UPI00325BE4C4